MHFYDYLESRFNSLFESRVDIHYQIYINTYIN